MIFAFVVSFVVVRKIIFSRGRILKIAVVFYNTVIGLEFAFVNQTSRTFDRLSGFFFRNRSVFQFLICFTRSSVGRDRFLNLFFFAVQIIVAGNKCCFRSSHDNAYPRGF